jgi:hypothetical protein
MSAASLPRVARGVSRTIPPVVLSALNTLNSLGRSVVYTTQFVYHLLMLFIESPKTGTMDHK